MTRHSHVLFQMWNDKALQPENAGDEENKKRKRDENLDSTDLQHKLAKTDSVCTLDNKKPLANSSQAKLANFAFNKS